MDRQRGIVKSIDTKGEIMLKMVKQKYRQRKVDRHIESESDAQEREREREREREMKS